MTTTYNQPVTIQNVVDRMIMKTGVNDEKVIRTHMYNFVKKKGNVTLNDYLNKPPTANSMLGTSRHYASFIMDPLKKAIEKNADSESKNENYNKNFPPLGAGKRRKRKLTKKNRRKSKKSRKSRKHRK